MKKTKNLDLIPKERITDRIYVIRGKKVMLDTDLARLYNVKPIRLREQVKRNIERFPEDFMFQLNVQEVEFLLSQNAIPSKKHLGGSLPYVFTEHGILMLSSVLNSQQAIQVNIQIMRTFTRLRELMATNELLRQKIEEIEGKNNKRYASVFRQIKYLLDAEEKRQRDDLRPKQEIGFKDRK